MKNVDDGYYLSQEELREIFIPLRLKFALSYETLGKLCDMDAEILQAWEEGQLAFTKEAFSMLFSVYEKLSHPNTECN